MGSNLSAEINAVALRKRRDEFARQDPACDFVMVPVDPLAPVGSSAALADPRTETAEGQSNNSGLRAISGQLSSEQPMETVAIHRDIAESISGFARTFSKYGSGPYTVQVAPSVLRGMCERMYNDALAHTIDSKPRMRVTPSELTHWLYCMDYFDIKLGTPEYIAKIVFEATRAAVLQGASDAGVALDAVFAGRLGQTREIFEALVTAHIMPLFVEMRGASGLGQWRFPLAGAITDAHYAAIRDFCRNCHIGTQVCMRVAWALHKGMSLSIDDLVSEMSIVADEGQRGVAIHQSRSIVESQINNYQSITNVDSPPYVAYIRLLACVDALSNYRPQETPRHYVLRPLTHGFSMILLLRLMDDTRYFAYRRIIGNMIKPPTPSMGETLSP